MSYNSDQLVFGLVTFFVASAVALFLYLARGNKDNTESENEGTTVTQQPKKKKTAPPPPSKKALRKERGDRKESESSTNHPWLCGTLKGHSGSVLNLDFSLNGKYLASCADDRTVLIWMTKDFLITNHKQIRTNLSLDYAHHVFWSPDGRAFLVSKHDEHTLEVFKLGKKADGSIGNIQQALTLTDGHSSEIIGIAVASNGKFMVSASRDGSIVFWDVKGNILKTIKTSITDLNCLKLSNCGRFIGICGKSPEIIVYSVVYGNKGAGAFETITQAYTLKGHGKEIFSIDINTDASLIASIDNTGTWRLYDTTGTKTTLQVSNKVENIEDAEQPLIVRLSNDSRILAVGAKTTVELFSTKTGKFLERVETYYEGHLTDIKFSIDNKFFVTSAADERSIKIFHNVAGYAETKRDLKEQSKSSDISASVRDRLISEAEGIETLLKELKLRLSS